MRLFNSIGTFFLVSVILVLHWVSTAVNRKKPFASRRMTHLEYMSFIGKSLTILIGAAILIAVLWGGITHMLGA